MDVVGVVEKMGERFVIRMRGVDEPLVLIGDESRLEIHVGIEVVAVGSLVTESQGEVSHLSVTRLRELGQ